MRLDLGIEMTQVPSDAEPTAGLHKAMGQPELDMQRVGEKSSLPPANPSSPKSAEYVVDRIARHRVTGSQTEYKVCWYGYSTRKDTYESPSELPTKFFRRYWAARRRHKVPMSKQTGERKILRQGKKRLFFHVSSVFWEVVADFQMNRLRVIAH